MIQEGQHPTALALGIMLHNRYMSLPEWWNSPERIGVWHSRFSTIAMIAAAVAMLGWAMRIFILAVPASVLATAAILMTLFTWFRKDDLASRAAPPRK